MNRRFAASLMIVTAGILMAPAAGVASAATGSVICDENNESHNEGGMSCANSVNEEVGNGSSAFDIDLSDFTALIESITKG